MGRNAIRRWKCRIQKTSCVNYEPDRTGRKERFYETVH